MPSAVGADRVESGTAGTLVLCCTVAKGWKARIAASGRQAEHPGTAISWEDEIFEVVGEEVLPGGGLRYSLAPWRNDHAIRSLERYDAASEARRARERRWPAAARRKRRLAIVLSPILGHLPGAVQEAMESEFGAPANAMTVASAIPLLVIGLFGLMGWVVGLAGVSLAPLPQPPFPLAIYLLAESAVRLTIVATQSRPAGSIPGTLAWEIGVAFARALPRRS